MGLSHLRGNKFKHSFQNCLNPLCLCGNEIETSTYYLLHCPTYTNERMILVNKIKIINCSILESSDATVTKLSYLVITLLVILLIPHFELNNWIQHIYSKIWRLHFKSRIIIKKHYLAFLLAFILFYLWNDLVYLVYLSLLIFSLEKKKKITWWL